MWSSRHLDTVMPPGSRSLRCSRKAEASGGVSEAARHRGRRRKPNPTSIPISPTREDVTTSLAGLSGRTRVDTQCPLSPSYKLRKWSVEAVGNYAEMIDFLYKLTVSQARMKETACKILSRSEDVSLSECVHERAVGRQGKMKSLCKCNEQLLGILQISQDIYSSSHLILTFPII